MSVRTRVGGFREALFVLGAVACSGRVTQPPSPSPSPGPPVAASAAVLSEPREPEPLVAPSLLASADWAVAIEVATRPHAPSSEVLAVATDANQKLEEVLRARLGSPERICKEGEPCRWRFPRHDPDDPDVWPPSFLWIDEAQATVTCTTDWDMPGRPVAEFIAAKKVEEKVLAAIRASADVKRMCAQSRSSGAPCITFTSEMGGAVCPSPDAEKSPNGTVDLADPCLWGVYVGSNMGTHSSRLATMLVDPVTGKIVGVSDFACDTMSLAAWRKWKASGKECPGLTP
jgi:hypothetical protein